ncbi:MAG TPA: hypothetical protein PK358_05325 [Spirochaetota bacterium]|nr:hypothetical protein [Spirochaetota bacterium]HPJ34236.1 hypothetical protein [Spirochaetota bacterium]
MNVILYSAMCYGITIVISFAVIAIVVGINKFMNRYGKHEEGEV